jgi:spore coat protein CotF
VKNRLYSLQKNLIKETNLEAKEFEKYFEFKKKNSNDKIKLNNLEIQCASEIKMSIVP